MLSIGDGEWIGTPTIFMHLSDLEFGKGWIERDRVWRKHGEERTELFKEFQTYGSPHFIRLLIYDEEGHVTIVGFSVSDSASLVQGTGWEIPTTHH